MASLGKGCFAKRDSCKPPCGKPKTYTYLPKPTKDKNINTYTYVLMAVGECTT